MQIIKGNRTEQDKRQVEQVCKEQALKVMHFLNI